MTGPANSAVPERLRQRLSSLGVSIGVLTPDNRFALDGGSGAVERLITSSRPFELAIRSAAAELRRAAGVPTPLWPGLWLVALPGERRRRPNANDTDSILVAMLLGHSLLECEQLHLVCDSRKVDYRSVTAQINPASLMSDTEVNRLSRALGWIRQDTVEIDRRCGELHTMSQQLAESYEELSLLYKLSSNMTVNQAPQQFLTDACRELREVAGLTWMAILLVDDEPRLNELIGQVYLAAPPVMNLDRMREVGRRLLQQRNGDQKPAIIEDTTTIDVHGLPELANNVLVVPLTHEHRTLGILFGGDKLDGSQISTVDSKLCSSLANSLSIFLQNLMLYEDMQAMFLGTLHALTSSIDAKDSYTHGHSERVALMSRELARAAGCDEHTCERVYIAGLVHDVGKIGVPESVLCKPGPLTDAEFALIKMHPTIGGRILRDIKQMGDLIPGVLYHHERWDGRGYPYGLKGEDIPLFGRLIGLADSFDAMSSNRTYRKSMQLDCVMDEIRRCAGAQFDPVLAEVFVSLDFTPFFDLIEKHQAQQQRDAAEADNLRAAIAESVRGKEGAS
jgi:HD-GYP domain-containing protein (c-di-GMP phosphodiesterase class II)